MALLMKLVVAILFYVSPCISAETGLHLKSFSENQVEGCYVHSQNLGVCFDISQGYVKLLKTTGEPIVLYKEIGPEMMQYQVLDHVFIGKDADMVFVPDDVPRTLDALRAILKRKQEKPDKEALQRHYQQAMSEVHDVPEVKLIERVSAALGRSSKRLAILQPFHALCLNLMKASNVDIPSELKAPQDLEDYSIEGRIQKRQCRKPRANKCRGLCGKGCSCWRWFCGDCCWHRGCYEHDLCCKKRPYSSYCLVPVGLRCSRFKYYRKCMNSSSWWG